MTTDNESESARFLTTVNAMTSGYNTGSYNGRRYGVSVQRTANGRTTKLFARELGGTDIVSFNLFWPDKNRSLLKPCEMSSSKVLDFVLRFQSQTSSNVHDI